MHRADFIYRRPKVLVVLNILTAGVVVIFLFIFVRGVLTVTLKKAENPVAPAHAGIQKSAKRGLQEYAGILRNNPFGFPGGQLKDLSVSKEGGASPTELVLVGTVAGPPQISYAIVADKSGRQEVFRVGDTVFGAGRLKKVEKDRAIMDDGGREVNIPITDMLAIRELTPQEGAAVSGFARSTGNGTFIVDQKKVLNALENPNQLMTDARLQPNITNGRQEGFVLREVRSGGIYQSLGLQNGDVLLRINDYNISNPENALQAFTALRGMDRVQVDLMRNGARMTMTYQIR